MIQKMLSLTYTNAADYNVLVTAPILLEGVTKTEHKTKLLILLKLQFAAEIGLVVLQPEMVNVNRHDNPHRQF